MRYGDKNRLQAELFLYALGAGFLIGTLYAGLMFLRKLFPHRTATVIAEDILFFIIAALFSFIFLLDYNSGCVRMNLIVSECVGFCFIRGAASKIIRKFMKNTCKITSE